MDTENKNLNKGETLKVNISDIIKSASFKKAILEAIESGKGTDWGYDEDTGNEYSFDTFNSECSLDEVIRVIEEHFTPPLNWIPIEEKMPQEGQKVLVIGYKETEIYGRYEEMSEGLVIWESPDKSYCADICYYSISYTDITHWMPIPVPN